MPKGKTKKTKIEENLKELEGIVEKFEKGGLGIEQGIEEYARAAKLIENIKDELSSIELKIEEIRES